MKVCSGKKLARFKFQIQNWLYTLLIYFSVQVLCKKINYASSETDN